MWISGFSRFSVQFAIHVSDWRIWPWSPSRNELLRKCTECVRVRSQSSPSATTGTSDFKIIDRLHDCMLMLVVSAQAFKSLIPPQTALRGEIMGSIRLTLTAIYVLRPSSARVHFP